MLMLGSGFDRDPLIPWAAQQLNDESAGDAFARIRRVFDSSMKYLEDCFGPDNGQMVRTLVRLRDSKLSDAPQSDGLKFRSDLCKLLRFLAPQKFAVDGEDAVRGAIQDALFRALDYGITSAQGRTVFVCLMYLLGAEFDKDPMYPWASEALQGRFTDEAGGTEALYAAAMDYVESVLGEGSGGREE